MKISLVMGTVSRTEEPARFLAHLQAQTYRDFELIIVDSNPDDRLLPIINAYQSSFPITYLRFTEPGVSRARNRGLEHASGDIIGFPDDDCWYPPELLAEIAGWFAYHPDFGGLIGRGFSKQGTAVVAGSGRSPQRVNRFTVWSSSSTSTMFYRESALPTAPVFKEYLGVGAGTPWGAAEDAQLLIDVLNKSEKVYYQPGINIFHPDPFTYPRRVLHKRGYQYGCGMGYVMAINRYPSWFWGYYLLRALGGLGLALVRREWSGVGHYRQTLKGRWQGWKSGRQECKSRR